MNKTYQKVLRYEPLIHILFWSIILIYPRMLSLTMGFEYKDSIWHDIAELIFNMIPAYILYLWFFKIKQKWYHFILLSLLVVFNTVLYMYIDNFFHPENGFSLDKRTIIKNATGFISDGVFGLVFFALFSIKQLYKKQQEINEISGKEQKAQLRLLKGQINPHFLFNTLNTIYASALDKEEKTPELILKLADNFRYVLNEGQKNKVPLEKEVRHLKDYINLQQERLSNKVNVNWKESIDNYDQLIPPLLLISFVENAFKYSSMMTGINHNLNIKIRLLKNDFIFNCENPYVENTDKEIDSDWVESGIGIKNTKKRLELLFPKSHQLIIDHSNNKFKIDLHIKL